ncbi:MAG: hypothetical protein ABJE95_05880 [Byssovorax sp.]
MTSFNLRAHRWALRLVATAVTGVAIVAVLAPGCCFVECHGGCPDAAPAPNSECSSQDDPVCGPYDVPTSCGLIHASAACSPHGLWVYGNDCHATCDAITDPGACNAAFGCLWVVPCSDSIEPTRAGCTHPGTPCDSCGPGTTCQNLSFSPCSPGNADCSNCGALDSFCLPTPPAPTCSDGLKNGNESDVDCGGGGTCAACAAGKSCVNDVDCSSSACSADKCKP